MNDPQNIVVGMKVRVTQLGETSGMCIAYKHLALRQIDAIGTVTGFVPGHGGDVWWVEQADGIAAYVYTEFEKI